MVHHSDSYIYKCCVTMIQYFFACFSWGTVHKGKTMRMSPVTCIDRHRINCILVYPSLMRWPAHTTTSLTHPAISDYTSHSTISVDENASIPFQFKVTVINVLATHEKEMNIDLTPITFITDISMASLA